MSEPEPNPLLTQLEDLETRGMAKTKKWCAVWQDSMKWFFSDQTGGRAKHKDFDWIVINYIWPAAIQEISKLAKNNPKIITEPWENSDTEYAEMWRSVLQYLWTKGINGTGMRLEQLAELLCTKIFGYSVSKIFWEDKVKWDRQQKTWIGDVKYKLWHPAYFWALGKEKITDDACGTVRYVPLKWAQTRWPQFAQQMEQDSQEYKQEEFSGWGGKSIMGQTATSGVYPAQGTGGIDSGIGVSSSDVLGLIYGDDTDVVLGKGEKIVRISETYLYDYTEIPREETEDISPQELLTTGQATSDGYGYYDSSGAPLGPENWPKRLLRQYNEPQYPNGRYVIRIGKIILNPDPQSQVWSYEQWPFVVKPHYMLPFMWQGLDAVQLYKSTQDMINVSVTHLVNNLKMFGDPRVGIEVGALASPPERDKRRYGIGKAAGSVIQFVRGALSGNRFKIFDPVAPSPAAIMLYQLFAQEFKNLVGLQDISMGKHPGGRMTATESQHLAMSSVDRIFLQNVLGELWVIQVATRMAEICQVNYDIGRFVRIVGEDDTTGLTQIQQGMKNISFDVNIIPGTMLPFDEEKQILKFEKAMMALSQPIPNPMLPEYLRTLGIPSWQKILQRHDMWTKFTGFINLYQNVKSGAITPQDAIQLIAQMAMQEFMQQTQIEPMTAQTKPKYQQNPRILGESVSNQPIGEPKNANNNQRP